MLINLCSSSHCSSSFSSTSFSFHHLIFFLLFLHEQSSAACNQGIRTFHSMRQMNQRNDGNAPMNALFACNSSFQSPLIRFWLLLKSDFIFFFFSDLVKLENRRKRDTAQIIIRRDRNANKWKKKKKSEWTINELVRKPKKNKLQFFLSFFLSFVFSVVLCFNHNRNSSVFIFFSFFDFSIFTAFSCVPFFLTSIPHIFCIFLWTIFLFASLIWFYRCFVGVIVSSTSHRWLMRTQREEEEKRV